MLKKETRVKVYFTAGLILLVLMVGCSQVMDAYVLSQGAVGYAAGSLKSEEKITGELPEPGVAPAEVKAGKEVGPEAEASPEVPEAETKEGYGKKATEEKPEEAENKDTEKAKPVAVKKSEPQKASAASKAAKKEIKPVKTETKLAPAATDTAAKEEPAREEQQAEEKQQEQPAPEPQPEEKAAEEKTEVVASVTYKWGSARKFTFRSEVVLTNTGSEVANNVRVMLPMLENNSPYQKTVLKSTSHPITAKEGRVGTFVIESLEPGETQTIVTDYTITVRPVSITSTNETVEKARVAFNKYAGSGNCHTLAVGFVNEARSLGLKARVVTGFKRKDRGHMTSGSLQGCRHSWAEFYVEDLGWVPVDLTFKYFANFPYASHIIETYSDLSIKIRYKGGDISAIWKNSVL